MSNRDIEKVRILCDGADRLNDTSMRLALLDVLIEMRRAFEEHREPRLTIRQKAWAGLV